MKYRITKARETLEEVKLHIENELWNTAINRLYYACYYAVIALLLDKGIQPKTHNGVSDYGDYIEFTREDLIDLIKPANDLILKTEDLILKK